MPGARFRWFIGFLSDLPLDVVDVLLCLLLPNERVFRGAFRLDDGERDVEVVEEKVVDVLALQVVLQRLSDDLVGACEIIR